MSDPYDLNEPFLPPKLRAPAEVSSLKGFGERLKHVYLCETVRKITRFKQRRTRLWLVAPGVSLLCNMQGRIVRMLPLTLLEKVFVQHLAGPPSRVRMILKPETGSGEPTQVLELNATQDVKQILKTLNAVFRVVHDKVLDVEDISSNVHVHAETAKFGSLIKEFGYRPPAMKVRDWEVEPPDLKDYTGEGADGAPISPLNPTGRKGLALGDVSKAGGLYLEGEKRGGSESGSIGEDAFRHERELRDEAERRTERAERAANVLAEQLSHVTRSEASMIRITEIKTEGLDSLVRHCVQCADPITPYCSITGSRHTPDDLILTMFTSREIQHVATTTQAGVATYDISTWRPIHVATDRDVFFSWVSGNRLLGKTGVLISDLMPKGSEHSPELLWSPGIVIRLDGCKVGILRVRAVAHEEDGGERGPFVCVARHGCHALHILPQQHPTSTLAHGEIVMIHETTKIDGETWGRSGGYWVLIKDSRGEVYMCPTGSKAMHLWACVAAAFAIVIDTNLRIAADSEVKSLASLSSKFSHLEEEMRAVVSSSERNATAHDLSSIARQLAGPVRGGQQLLGPRGGVAAGGASSPARGFYIGPHPLSRGPLSLAYATLSHASPIPAHVGASTSAPYGGSLSGGGLFASGGAAPISAMSLPYPVAAVPHDAAFARHERIPVDAPVFGEGGGGGATRGGAGGRRHGYHGGGGSESEEDSGDIMVSVHSYPASEGRLDMSLYTSMDDDSSQNLS